MKNLDRRLLLLSGDWFIPYWGLIPIDAPIAERKRIQHVAQDAVRHIVGNATTYWTVDFSPVRQENTARFFMELVRKSRLGSGSHQVLEWVLEREIAGNDDSPTLWLFESLTESWISGSLAIQGADQRVYDQFISLAKQWYGTGPNIDLEEELATSTTEWDIYLRRLTPDIPTYLSDFARTQVEVPTNFKGFWISLQRLINEEDRLTIVSWYVGGARELVDPDFHVQIPGWMT